MLRDYQAQRGAAAIEFAFLFTLLLSIFYGLVGYALPLWLKQHYHSLSGNILRSMVSEPNATLLSNFDLNDPKHAQLRPKITQLQLQARKIVEESPLPKAFKQPCPSNHQNITYDNEYLVLHNGRWYSCVGMNPTKHLLPSIKLGGIHIPSYPEWLSGQAQIKL